MAKKTAEKKNTAKKNTVKKTTAKVDGIEFAPIADKKEGLSYGATNALRHGRYSQGGLIDQFVIRSVKTGKPFTLKEINEQRMKDNESRPVPCNYISANRLSDHLEHLKGSATVKGIQHRMDIQFGKDKDGNVLYLANWTDDVVNGKGEPVSKDEFLKYLTI